MQIIVGLGNPSSEYAKTRHNAGFAAVDLLREDLGFDDFKFEKKFNASLTQGALGEKKVILVKPQTFMNKSGEAVAKIVSFYKVPLTDLILIYDDIDLPLGEVRFREKGSGGTHNGMRSVIEALGAETFQRVRIGIESRSPEMLKKQDLSDFVLSKFSPSEAKKMHSVLREAVLIIKNLLS